MCACMCVSVCGGRGGVHIDPYIKTVLKKLVVAYFRLSIEEALDTVFPIYGITFVFIIILDL